MKKLFYIFSLVFILLSCKEKTQYLGYESIKGKLSYKEENPIGRGLKYHYLYIQTPTNTRRIEVSSQVYDDYKIGDPILLVIEKYQIPCKERYEKRTF